MVTVSSLPRSCYKGCHNNTNNTQVVTIRMPLTEDGVLFNKKILGNMRWVKCLYTW